jgi:hypothetical protein
MENEAVCKVSIGSITASSQIVQTNEAVGSVTIPLEILFQMLQSTSPVQFGER